MKIILFGAPGSGKGSQAKLINAEFGWPQISIGDILRKHISDGTELGKIAETYINKGQLVPDEFIIKLVKNRIAEKDCQNGYILDGYPRTYEQAVQLDKLDKIDLVIFIDITMNEVEKRALSRRICPACGKIFNISTRYIDKCDVCAVPLIRRDDDKIEVVRERIKTYLSQSETLLNHYKKVLVRVLSGDSPESTFEVVKSKILAIKKKK